MSIKLKINMAAIQYPNGRTIRVTSIYLPCDLADETRELGINRSRVATEALTAEVKRVKEQRAGPDQLPHQKGHGTTPISDTEGGNC